MAQADSAHVVAINKDTLSIFPSHEPQLLRG
jgi:hypothetical protein